MSARPIRRSDPEVALVTQLAAAVALLSFFYYFRHGDLLLYGDAVAHINIARRVFDSRTPGLLQLGTVWLPLPHLLMIPFLLFDSAWQSGVGGSIPSLAAFIFGVVGLFRLLRATLSSQSEPDFPARFAAWLGIVIYAANPNLIYMQTTAMTEALYLALFIWAVVFFAEFAQAVSRTNRLEASATSPLVKCGLCLAGACLTRYDGWFLTGALVLAVIAVVLKSKSRPLRRALTKFILIAVSAQLLWLAYNAIIYRNPLEFANGPYSARAIELTKTAMSATSPHPGWHNLPVAFDYFLKSAEQTVAEGSWQRLWVALLIAGAVIVLTFERKLWPILLLGLPFLFYALAIAYGSVPLYLPEWWPFSYYNVRFGLEALPAFAALVALTVHFLLGLARNRSARTAVMCGTAALLAGSYASVWRAQPICFREAWDNSRSRITLETELAANLRMLPRDSTLLMYLGDHVGALQRAGIPLRQTINEGNHRPWKRPSDPEGLWERALANPQKYADYVVAIEGDPVALGVNRENLSSMVVIHASGQPAAILYWTHARNIPGQRG